MASSSTSRQQMFLPDLEAAGERVRELGDRALVAGRKVTAAYLDGVEGYVHGVAQFERRIGEQTPVEPVAGALAAHARMTEELTLAAVGAARELFMA